MGTGGGGSTPDAGPGSSDAPMDLASEGISPSEGGVGPDAPSGGDAVDVATSDGPLGGSVCAAAVDVTPTGAAKRTTMGDATNARNNASLSPANSAAACRINLATDVNPLVGPDAVYSVVVPPRKQLTATVTPVFDWQPALWVAGDCAAPEASCLALSASRTSGAAEAVSWTNASAASKTVYLFVDSSGTSGAFSLDTSLADAAPAPANDTCAGAIPLTFTMGTTTVRGTTESAMDDEHPASSALPLVCRDVMDGWVGSDVVYSAVVPAGQRLTLASRAVMLIPPRRQAWNTALWVSESCTDAVATCLGAQDDDESLQFLNWTNPAATDKTVFIHVDSHDPSGGDFFLVATVGPIGPNLEDVCPGMARDPNTSWIGTTSTVGADDSFGPSTVSAACRGAVKKPWLGRDAVSSFVVPPGKTFAADVKSTTGTNDYLLLLSTTCGSMVETGAGCVAAGQSVSWKNDDAAPRTVYLFVDTESAAKPTTNYQITPSLK